MTGRIHKPILLDLFCGAGGAAKGYADAGFEIVGVDISPQPRFPFEFHQADAMTYPLEGFDVIHTSPPCPRFSSASQIGHSGLSNVAQNHPDLVTPTRKRLKDQPSPYVIENVPGAPLQSPLVLCGSMFGLHLDGNFYRGYLRRHRLFESSIPLEPPCRCDHRGKALGVFGHGSSGRRRTRPDHQSGGGVSLPADEARSIMGIDWMNRNEVAQAIPPAYTEYIGHQLMEYLA